MSERTVDVLLEEVIHRNRQVRIVENLLSEIPRAICSEDLADVFRRLANQSTTDESVRVVSHFARDLLAKVKEGRQESLAMLKDAI